MRHRDTVVRFPHDEWTDGDGREISHDEWIKGDREPRDPRMSVTMQEEGATLTLFFDGADLGKAFRGEAPVIEVRLEPSPGGTFEPWRLLPNLPLHLQYARAAVAQKRNDADAALRALRATNSPRRGLNDDFLRAVAEKFKSLTAEGEPYPAKAIARSEHADKSTVSRWLKAARDRGLLAGDKT